jgi:hypothetical protein
MTNPRIGHGGWCSLRSGSMRCDCDWFEQQGRPIHGLAKIRRFVMKIVTGMVAAVAGIGIFAAIRMAFAKGNAPQTTAEPPIQVDDVLLVDLSHPKIIHSPTTTMDFGTRPMRTISLSSVQGPDFIMVKKESTFNDPNTFIVSIPRAAIVRNLRPTGGGISF